MFEGDDDPVTRKIIGAALRVHTELGSGLLEAVYQWALGVDLELEGVSFEREAAIPIWYRGRRSPVPYRADFRCGEVIVELKAISNLGRVEEAQVIHYLRTTGLPTGLLLNFGSENLQIRRLVNRRVRRRTDGSLDSPESVFGESG